MQIIQFLLHDTCTLQCRSASGCVSLLVMCTISHSLILVPSIVLAALQPGLVAEVLADALETSLVLGGLLRGQSAGTSLPKLRSGKRPTVRNENVVNHLGRDSSREGSDSQARLFGLEVLRWDRRLLWRSALRASTTARSRASVTRRRGCGAAHWTRAHARASRCLGPFCPVLVLLAPGLVLLQGCRDMAGCGRRRPAGTADHGSVERLHGKVGRNRCRHPAGWRRRTFGIGSCLFAERCERSSTTRFRRCRVLSRRTLSLFPTRSGSRFD